MPVRAGMEPWLAFALLAAAAPLGAQTREQTPELGPGERVRVHAGPYRLRTVGTVVEADWARIVLTREGDGGRVEIPYSTVRDVAVYRGRSRLRGAAIGALVGAPAGFLAVNLYTVLAGYRYDYFALAAAIGIGMPAGALVGGGIGGSVGVPRWVLVYDQPAVSLAPAPGGGVRLGVSLPVR